MAFQKISLAYYVGKTPIVRINKLISEKAGDLYIKLEEFNPGGSIKTRIAMQMIIDAENNGILHPNSGQTIIEPTGGNTGAGLAIVGAQRGYRVVLVIPDNYSREKVKVMKSYGADVILSNSNKGNDSHIRLVEEILHNNSAYIYLNQFSNISNPKSHYKYTAEEIINIIGKVDCFVAGIGSGGTISGVGSKLKEKYRNVKIIGVQPIGCDVLNGKAIPHKIEGISIGMIPSVLDKNIVDDVLSVEYDDVMSTLKKLAKEEGLLLGLSSGANLIAAIVMAKRLGRGKKIVTVSPDGGRNYLSHFHTIID